MTCHSTDLSMLYFDVQPSNVVDSDGGIESLSKDGRGSLQLIASVTNHTWYIPTRGYGVISIGFPTTSPIGCQLLPPNFSLSSLPSAKSLGVSPPLGAGSPSSPALVELPHRAMPDGPFRSGFFCHTIPEPSRHRDSFLTQSS